MNKPNVKVETDVPIPKGNIRNKYPMNTLEVGESFVFPLTDRPSLASMASRKKAIGKAFTIKQVDEHNCRIWRVK